MGREVGRAWSSMYLPKRLLFSLRSVLALPKASSTGLVCSSRSRTVVSPLVLARPPDTSAMYSITRLAASVLPAPDSPLTTMHWSS